MKQRRRLEQRRWRELLAEQAASGQTVAGFCGGRGIAVSTFFARRRALATPASMPMPMPTLSPMVEAAFVEVVAENIQDHGDHPRLCERADTPPATNGSSELELELVCGVKIAVGQGFDAALLRRVVEALS